ncbi:hypothetical protein V1477_006241 [Vespula maculifrons]|uniref:Uncharacterized protein n=1 Tax=Vespula maculifrons TaxID=7453 RepID=A0ABD2CJZ8_VESMC
MTRVFLVPTINVNHAKVQSRHVPFVESVFRTAGGGWGTLVRFSLATVPGRPLRSVSQQLQFYTKPSVIASITGDQR